MILASNDSEKETQKPGFLSFSEAWTGCMIVLLITIGNLDRLVEREYREQCSVRIAEIVLSIENYLGVSRLFIP